jgi:vacuolar-type H+-ATPase subunit H
MNLREISDAEREAWETVAEAERRLEDARLRLLAVMAREARKRAARERLRVVDRWGESSVLP